MKNYQVRPIYNPDSVSKIHIRGKKKNICPTPGQYKCFRHSNNVLSYCELRNKRKERLVEILSNHNHYLSLYLIPKEDRNLYMSNFIQTTYFSRHKDNNEPTDVQELKTLITKCPRFLTFGSCFLLEKGIRIFVKPLLAAIAVLYILPDYSVIGNPILFALLAFTFLNLQDYIDMKDEPSKKDNSD